MAKRQSPKSKKAPLPEREWLRRLYDWKRGLVKRGGYSPAGLTVEWARKQDKCVYCGVLLTWENVGLDHKMPFALGGTNDLANLHAVCQLDNRSKGSLTHEQYSALMVLLHTRPPYDERSATMILRKLRTAWRVT